MARFASANCRNGPKLIRATPSGTERRRVVLGLRQPDRVDRQRQFSCQPAQRVRVVAAHRIEHVGARLGGLGQPGDGPVDAIGLVAVLAQEQVGAGVDHHMHPGGVGGPRSAPTNSA